MTSSPAPTPIAYDPAAAAALLARAWRNGTQLVELPVEVRPQTVAHGYLLQDAMVAALGERHAGWKLAVANVQGLRAAGLDAPLVGQLQASRCHGEGDPVMLPGDAAATVEFEVAFTLARDVRPGEAPADVRSLVASTHVALEFVSSRFTDRRAAGWPSFVGDNAGFGALLLGPAIDPARIDDVVRTVVLSVHGQEVARGLEGDALTDPWASLSALVAHAAQRGLVLGKGDVVTTGTVAKPFDIGAAVSEIEARFLDQVLTVKVGRLPLLG